MEGRDGVSWDLQLAPSFGTLRADDDCGKETDGHLEMRVGKAGCVEMKRGYRRFVLAFAGILAIALLGGVCGWWSAHRARAELAEKWERARNAPWVESFHDCTQVWNQFQAGERINPQILFEDAKLAIRSGNITRARLYTAALRQQNYPGIDALLEQLPKDDQGR